MNCVPLLWRSAVVAQVDHRIGERLEGVVHVTDAFEPQQQTVTFIFPGEHALNGAKALFKDRRIEASLTTAFEPLRPRGFSGMLGTMPRLKIALRLARQS
jgi:hypothetical protein